MLAIKNLSNRIYQVDIVRGIACVSMPIFHTVYNLYALGLISEPLTRSLFWVVYQKIGLGTFVFVSGMSFILSTQNGVNWPQLNRRLLKLGGIAAAISLITWLVFPDKFVKFGVLHFFTAALLLAPFFKQLKYWALIPAAIILITYAIVGKGGLVSNLWLYPFGLMSHRPSSVDYIPLIPWFGVFLLGMVSAYSLVGRVSKTTPATWMKPLIWLGQHSLFFYIAHQIVVYGVLMAIALLIKSF
ncbi:DUF1624 domain-containing protein [Alteromonas sp. 5E99-2]|uniref:heparan-alpha-glucosaminide N-acetyltransferase n=1 Tax=Alteromonas sp. 5E99-2 TaxID=2817683 RepID=UPI001A993E62|nr:heparan-alpha-glucosaminide N-acetyltransferase [Alteromonas sp. 5E99-2]MBO1256018.1 DUF1624 domain-containing protein [Alteromonas sp. 5E99-2]